MITDTPCGKCLQKTYSRLAFSHEGSVIEVFCPIDGWSKPLALCLASGVQAPGGPVFTPPEISEVKRRASHSPQRLARNKAKREMWLEKITATFQTLSGSKTEKVAQTAAALGISDKTVWNYLGNRMVKVQAKKPLWWG